MKEGRERKRKGGNEGEKDGDDSWMDEGKET